MTKRGCFGFVLLSSSNNTSNTCTSNACSYEGQLLLQFNGYCNTISH